MTVAVTGASGFLGTHLLRVLRDESPSEHLIGVDIKRPVEPVDGVRYSEDIREATLIFHLAGSGGVEFSLQDPSEDLSLNAGLTVRMLQRATQMGARVVLASSAAVYGPVEGEVDESCMPNPISPYGVSKVAAESYGRVFGRLHDVDVRVARIGNAYGPGQRRLLIWDLAHRAITMGAPLVVHGAGDEVRDFVHGADVARALMIIAHRGTAGEIYNVGSGEKTTVLDVAGLVASAVGLGADAVRVTGEAQTGKVKAFHPSIDKLCALGYRPRFTLSNGIRDTVAWVRSQT